MPGNGPRNVLAGCPKACLEAKFFFYPGYASLVFNDLLDVGANFLFLMILEAAITRAEYLPIPQGDKGLFIIETFTLRLC
jgi:hypothetical protein